MDISINMFNGIRALDTVNHLCHSVGAYAARALIVTVKSFLSQRGLNEVYTGGLGSYSVICMVISFLQVRADAPLPLGVAA